ncbi:MAG TPA: sigma 54-interacting transcriptional regulator, partial [Candidatus Bathyarchaeia archaeon]|nr:sigma 54-interacting transcriptional regulator [Candidatus Bathyarchaeia archaeon]
MDPGPPELEERCRRFLEGRGDAVAPLFRSLGEDGGARAGTGAWAALIVSRIFLLKGNIALSRSFLRLAAARSALTGGRTLRLGILVNQALILKARGKTLEAASLLRAVVDRALLERETLVAAKAASNLALCMARCGEVDGAASYLGLAERCFSALGCEGGLIRLGMTRALVEAKQGMFEEAVDRLSSALGRCGEERFARERAAGLLLLAELFIGTGDLARAREALDGAASMREALERFGRERLEWLCLESAFHRASGNAGESRRFAAAAESLRRRLGIATAYEASPRGEAAEPFAARETAPRIVARRHLLEVPGAPMEKFITCDSATREILEEIACAARLSLPICLEGESGTGKDLVARLIHRWSGREGEPFVPVNVAALPVELFESMAFGHARGAFTGAAASHPGLVAAAGKGTLFLDEIGELASPAQAKL